MELEDGLKRTINWCQEQHHRANLVEIVIVWDIWYKMKKKPLIKIMLGLAISLILIIFIIKYISFGNVLNIISSANSRDVLTAFILYLSSFIFRTLRWDIILTKLQNKNFFELLSIILIGWGGNNILPARMGDFIRGYLLKSKKDVSFCYSFSTICLEKVFDGIVLIFFMMVIFLLFSLPQWATKMSIIATLIFIPLIIGFFIFNFKDKLFIKKLNLMPCDRLKCIIVTGLEGTYILKEGKRQYICWLYSISVWLLELSVFYFAARSLTLEVPFYIIVLALVSVNFGIIVPSAPGYIGTFEAFCALALTSYGIDVTSAIAYALLVHGIQFLAVTPISIFLVVHNNISIKDIYSRP